VAGVLGILPDRGDQLVIESLPFEQTRALDEAGELGKPVAAPHAPPLKFYEDRRVLIGGGVGALLIVLLVVFRLLRKGKPVSQTAQASAALPSGKQGSSGHGTEEIAPAAHPAVHAVAAASPNLQLPAITSKAQEMLNQIQDNVQNDPAFAANIVRGWLEED
jgi:flagellar biosynthesis/type III secretory pathway M-ring protein FliF/YscJ